MRRRRMDERERWMRRREKEDIGEGRVELG